MSAAAAASSSRASLNQRNKRRRTRSVSAARSAWEQGLDETREEEHRLVEWLQEGKETVPKKQTELTGLQTSIQEMEFWNWIMFAPVESPK
jgi:hypothetical protein